MSVETDNGSVLCNYLNAVVHREDSEEQFLATIIGQCSKLAIDNSPFRSYDVTGVELGEQPCVLTLFYESGTLTWINIVLVDRLIENSVATGLNYSETELAKDKRKQDKWLGKVLGRQRKKYDFTWGFVESILDVRSWNVAIVVRFRNES